MRQISILPSGCQLNHRNSVLYFSHSRILYASSLAVYVLNPQSYEIVKVLSVNQRSITSISVSPHDSALVAVGSIDGCICVWNIDEEEVIGRLSLTIGANVAWDPSTPNKCALLQENQGIKLLLWDIFNTAANNITESLHVRNELLKSSLFRWSPNISGCLAIGCNAGATIIYKQRDNTHKILQATDRKTTVVDLQWDRLSTSYLLVAYQYHLILWDIDQGSEVSSFEKQPLAITSVLWLDWTAGNFLTTNSRNHILKVWNASQSAPIDSIKVKAEGGITSSCLCPGKMRSLFAAMDGSIAVYDMKNNQVTYKSSAGHTETIFACKFAPNSPHSFATGSYDGTIKIWATDTLSLQRTLIGNGEIIYCLDWSPTGKLIATSSYSGLVTIWDTENGMELARFLNHTKAAFFVAWNQRDERYLLSSSADCSVFVLELDFEELYNDVSTAKSITSRKKNSNSHKDNLSVAKVKKRYQHDAQVFGVSWSVFHRDIFCTCSQDGFVRIFNAAIEHATMPIAKLSGHSSRVFSCAWSPLIEGLLATGSDDHTIIVWQLERLDEPSKCSNSFRKLIGHKGFVRALCWNFENPNLLLSGSWDNSIRLWDISIGTCIYELHEHIADVYALTTSPFRPCSYISASRDTTIRLWELQGSFTLMRYYTIWDENLSRAKHMVKNSSMEALSQRKVNSSVPCMNGTLQGVESIRLERMLCDETIKNEAEKYYRIFYFYTSAPAYLDIWENVLKLLESVESESAVSFGFLRSSSLRQVYHESEILSMARATIKSYESMRRRTDGGTFKDESVSMMHCKLGDFERYCQSLIDEGKWEAAISIAPTVSIEYWKSLVEQYGKMLVAKGSEDCVPYLMSVNRHQEVVNFYINRNDSSSAMIIAKASQYRIIQPSLESFTHDASKFSTQENHIIDGVGLYESQILSQKGQPLLASAKLIAIGRVEDAITLLMNNFEFDLAFALSKVFRKDASMIIALWAERCACWGSIDLAVEILQHISTPNKDKEIALLLSKFCEVPEADRIMRDLKLQTIEAWLRIAHEEEATGSDHEAVVSYIVCREYGRATEIAMQSLNRYIHDPWSATAQSKKLYSVSRRIRAYLLPPTSRKLFLVTMLWFSTHDAILCGALQTAIQMLNVILDHCSQVEFNVSEDRIKLWHSLLLILCGDRYGRNILAQLRPLPSLGSVSFSIDVLLKLIQDEDHWSRWMDGIAVVRSLDDFRKSPESLDHSSVQSIASAILDISIGAKLPSWATAKNCVKSRFSEVDFMIDLACRKSNATLMGSMLPVANQKLKLHPSFISGDKIQGTFCFVEEKPVSINELANWARFFPYSPSMNGEFLSF